MGGAKHAEVSYVPLICQDLNGTVINYMDPWHPYAFMASGERGEGVGVVPNTSPL